MNKEYEKQQNQIHECYICGYQWKHGQHGGHNCHDFMVRKDQLAGNWQPIEKLKTEILKDGDLLVLLGRFDSIVSVGTDDYGNPSYMFDNQFLTDVDGLEDILMEYKYTRYTLLTPSKL